MKRMLTIIFAACCLAAVSVAADGWNPHHGLNHLFKTTWDHRNPAIVRYDPPASIARTTDTIQYTITTDGNLDRPVTSHVTPCIRDARKPLEANSYEWVEDWRLERQPVQGGSLKYNLLFPGDLIDQWRVQHPATATAPETYSKVLQFFGRDHMAFGNGGSQINYVSFGPSELIKVHGSGRVDLGFISFMPALNSPYPGHAYIDASPNVVVEKNGVKYLKVRSAYKQYGVKLEPMEW